MQVPLEPAALGVPGLDDARARREQLLAGLGVRERGRDEARELADPLLGLGWERPSVSETATAPQGSPDTATGATTTEVTPLPRVAGEARA